MLHLQLSDHDVEQLFAGDQPQDRPDYAEVALLMRRLRAEGDHERVPPMSPQLLAALDKAEAEAAEQQASHRAETRRRVSEARRRWRVVAAAAAVVVLAGIGVAHAQGAFSASDPTHTVDVSSGGADLGPEGGDGRDDTFAVDVPPTELTVPPTPPPTAAPPTTAPTPETTTGDQDRDGDGDGRDGRDWDGDRDRWDWDEQLEWNPRQVPGGYENDFDGEDGPMPPLFFEQRWWDECDGDRDCLARRWWEDFSRDGPNGPGDGDGPGVYSPSGP